MNALRQNIVIIGRRKFLVHSKSNLGAATSLVGATRDYRITERRDNVLLYGGLAVLGTAILGQYSYDLYVQIKNRPKPPELTPEEKEAQEAEKKANMKAEEEATSQAREEKKKEKAKGKEGVAPNWLDQWFAKRFYDGGFEEKMTKREAALILGVRESAEINKVKAAHRRILLLNHPDMGGSPFIASKVNEAKDLLLKGRE